MQHIRYTYVDAVTGVPVTIAPAANGPAMPAIPGLQYLWSRESAWPTSTPDFFGTLPEGVPVDVPGVLEVMDATRFADLQAAELAARATVARERAKAQRQAQVDVIKVTTSSGRVFDGDETSQTRMARAIVGLQAAQAALGPAAPTDIVWVLADNTAVSVTAAELSEALILAGQAQAAIWVIQ